MNATDELIRLYAKQLKIPSFTEYQEVLRQADPSSGFEDLLLAPLAGGLGEDLWYVFAYSSKNYLMTD